MDEIINRNDIESDNHAEVPQMLEVNVKEEWQGAETHIQEIKQELQERKEELNEDYDYDFSNFGDLLSVSIKSESIIHYPEYCNAESRSTSHCSVSEEISMNKTFTQDEGNCDDKSKSVCEENIQSSSNSNGSEKASVSVPGEELSKSLVVEEQEEIYEMNLNIISSNYLHQTTEINKCNQCHKTFSRREYLESHISAVHDGNKIKCKECDKMFCHKISLRNHVKVIHRGIKKYKCEVCDKRFSQMISLRTHINAIHKRIKNHECSVCHKTFYDLASVNRHINGVHKGIKYECKECHKMLSDIGSLKKHIKGVHKMN